MVTVAASGPVTIPAPLSDSRVPNGAGEQPQADHHAEDNHADHCLGNHRPHQQPPEGSSGDPRRPRHRLLPVATDSPAPSFRPNALSSSARCPRPNRTDRRVGR